MKIPTGTYKRHLCVSLSLLAMFSMSQCYQPTANTTSGLLRGFSPYPNVHAYLGIPYAQPPVGDLRFAPPQPLQGMNTSIRDCYDLSPGCFQHDIYTAFSDRSTGVAESEDMLTLNIVSLAPIINIKDG